MSKLIIALYVIITSAALVILKLGTQPGATNYLSGKVPFNINLFTITGVLLYSVSFVIYTVLISRYDLGYIIPLAAAFVYILIFTASFFVFNETFTTVKVIGILLIIAGLGLLNIKS